MARFQSGERKPGALGLSGKLAVGIGAALTIASLAMALASAFLVRERVAQVYSQTARDLTTYVAAGIGNALKFGRAEIAEEAFEVALEEMSGRILRLEARTLDGALLTASGAESAVDVDNLVAAALAEGGRAASADGMIVAQVVFAGRTPEPAGVLVTIWSDRSVTESFEASLITSAAVGGGLAAILVVLALIMLRGLLTKPLRTLSDSVERLLRGEAVSLDAIAARRDEVGALARTMRLIHANAAAAQRIKTAVDSSDAATMICDAEGVVRYVNAPMERVLEAIKPAVRAFDADFETSSVIGRPVAAIDKALCEGQTCAAANAADSAVSCEIDGRVYAVRAEEIKSAGGERLGVAQVWTDRTREVAMEREIAAMIEAARGGDFSRRLDAGTSGFAATVSSGLNALAELTERFLEEIGGVVERMARRDLTGGMDARFEGRFGEVSDALTGATAALSEALSRIGASAEAISQAGAATAGDARDLAERTETQAGALQQTSATMEQLSGAVKANADLAAEADRVAGEAGEMAERGGRILSETVAAMERIKVSSEKISEIVTVIDGIAFQTNLLALNAAVEAARAGESGKGFAVVASEVRTLAQRAADAAKGIGALISEGSTHVRSGVSLVEESGGAIEAIMREIARLGGGVSKISEQCRSQATGVAEISQALRELDDVTQRNAATADRSLNGARRLNDEAERLAGAVEGFTLSAADAAPSEARAAA